MSVFGCVAGFARDCNAARLNGVNVLLMAPFLGMQTPSVLLDYPDNIANLGDHCLNFAIKSIYRGAPAADPKLRDAAYNLEIAKKKLEDLKRRQRSEAAKEYSSSSMRRELAATSDPNEIPKDAKQRCAKQEVPRRSVATDW